MLVEYIDNNTMFRESFKNYREAAQFIMLTGEYKAPVSVNQIVKMLQVSKLTGLPAMGSWYAIA